METQPTLKDEDGNLVQAGDTIKFSFGIPPKKVLAKIVSRKGRLVALTPNNRPQQVFLKDLSEYVGEWWKVE